MNYHILSKFETLKEIIFQNWQILWRDYILRNQNEIFE